MQTYRVTFHLTSPSLTLWQADTLFGHLCWALARREGEAAVQSLLEACRAGRPPLLLSDGFPGDMLPRPLFPPIFITTGTVEAQRQAMRQEKETKAVVWLSMEEFTRNLGGERVRPVYKES